MKPWRYSSANDLGLDASHRFCSLHRENSLAQSLLRLSWLASLRLVFKFWNRLEVHGLQNLPTSPPFVLTANHCSHLDGLVLASALPIRWRDRISPLAAGDYFFSSTSLGGFSATILNALPLWRQRRQGQRHELGDLRDRLCEQSAIYIVFPEGTRSRDGRLNEFKPGFGTLVAGTTIPILPCHIAGSFAALPPDTGVVRPNKIVLQIGSPVLFEDVPNHVEGWRQICAVIHQKTVALQTSRRSFEESPQTSCHTSLRLIYRFARLLCTTVGSATVRHLRAAAEQKVLL